MLPPFASIFRTKGKRGKEAPVAGPSRPIEGRPLTIVTIASDALTAAIDPFGAELNRLILASGEELLWNGDPAVWKGRAPILFPIVGHLRDGRYRLDGRSFAMPKHGFARHSLFEMKDRQNDRVTLALTDSEETRASFPFAFRLEMEFAVRAAALTVTAQVANLGPDPMPVSFGFHPALRWPLPFGAPRDAHRLQFASDEPALVRRMTTAGLLDDRPFPSPVTGRTLALDDDLFVDDAIIFDDLRSTSLRYGADGFPQIELTWDNLPHFGLWTKPGANYICLEPWQGYNDPEAFDGDIWAKPGIVAVAPGDSRSFAITIAIVGTVPAV